MSFALIRLFLGGALKSVIAWLSRFFAALNVQGWIGLVVCGLLAFLFIRAEGESRHWHKQSDRYEKLYTAEHSKRLADRKSYTDAQTAAAAQNKAQVAKVEQQYQRNSDNEKQSYLDDLARLRRMRGQGSTAQGAANGSGSPAPHGPASGADANGLPVPSGDDVQAASEIELRLMHLQNWVEQQLAVDPNLAH